MAVTAKKPSAPDIKLPKEEDPEIAAKRAETARERARKQAIAAGGTQASILTGPMGLGAVAAENKATKTILGG